MSGIGQELRKQRESRNISLDEMSSATRIVRRYLEALEEDRLERIPGGFFLKALIRSYAAFVGLDPEEVIARYRAAGIIDARPEPSAEETPEPRGFAWKKSLLFLSLAAAAVLVLVLAAILILKPSGRGPGGTAPATAVQAEQYKLLPPATPPAASEPAPTAEEKKPEGLSIIFSFNEETWLQVYADGLLVVDGLFEPGKQVQANAAGELLIHIGNAGGVTFTLNGKPGRGLGLSGQVRRNIRITLENSRDFLSEPAETPASPQSH
jgi:transcriptional regulator with XRE-family HTH domain